MKKLVPLSVALLLAGQAGAYAAQGDHAGRHHKRLMSAHAQSRAYEGGVNYRTREYVPATIAPSYGDDPEAEGRSSGG
jgi:hypothetical protein